MRPRWRVAMRVVPNVSPVRLSASRAPTAPSLSLKLLFAAVAIGLYAGVIRVEDPRAR